MGFDRGGTWVESGKGRNVEPPISFLNNPCLAAFDPDRPCLSLPSAGLSLWSIKMNRKTTAMQTSITSHCFLAPFFFPWLLPCPLSFPILFFLARSHEGVIPFGASCEKRGEGETNGVGRDRGAQKGKGPKEEGGVVLFCAASLCRSPSLSLSSPYPLPSPPLLSPLPLLPFFP